MTNTQTEAFPETTARIIHETIGGWHIAFLNNEETVHAWRSDGGCLMEAEGTVDDWEVDSRFPGRTMRRFTITRSRILQGAVDFYSGDPLPCPRPWRTPEEVAEACKACR